VGDRHPKRDVQALAAKRFRRFLQSSPMLRFCCRSEGAAPRRGSRIMEKLVFNEDWDETARQLLLTDIEAASATCQGPDVWCTS